MKFHILNIVIKEVVFMKVYNDKNSLTINAIGVVPAIFTLGYYNYMYSNNIKISSIFISILTVICAIIASYIYTHRSYDDEYQKLKYRNGIIFFMVCFIAPRVNEILEDVYYTEARRHFFDILPGLVIVVCFLILSKIDIQLPQNKYSIIANKYTLQDIEIWDKTQRFALRYTYYICGGIIVYLSIFSPFFELDMLEVIKLVSVISTALIMPHVYAMKLYNNKNNSKSNSKNKKAHP